VHTCQMRTLAASYGMLFSIMAQKIQMHDACTYLNT